MIRKLLSLLIFFTCSIACAETIKTDVLVVGGGASGVAAAIQSARSNVKTLLIEQSPWLGGSMTAGGMCILDANRNLPSGIYEEFRSRINTFYKSRLGYDTTKHAVLTFEPGVGASVLKKWTDTVKQLTVKMGVSVATVKKDGTGWEVTVNTGDRTDVIKAKVLVDATELGDIGAKAGALFNSGFDSRKETAETLAPENSTNQIQDISWLAILKDYADYSWSLDPTHYTIFEHLGTDSEEQQWANYRINETPSKGVMLWGEYTAPYAQLAEGYATNADISRMNYAAHGFTEKRLMGYPESHDKERMMYSAKTYGNASGANPPLNNLTNSLKRMSSIGAISILIPGPKMIWHFAELGYDDSIWTCNNGVVNTDSDTTTGDCKLDTKPQNQWTGNWLADTQRSVVYNNYAKFISLKINEPVFEGTCTISPDSNNIKQRIYITNLNVPATQLRNVVILANFSVADLAINPSFPFTGTWYN
ncbi:MAG: FAD-dependent oxidoreductase, partial [Sphingobacteriales bacterium]